MLIRGLVFSLAVAASCWSPAQQAVLDQKVTFEAKAARASQLLADLSKQVKVDLVPAGKMVDEVLSVRVSDVKLSDLMAKIADVAGGEWKPSGAGYQFVYDDAKLKARDRAHADKIAQGILKSLQKRIGKQDLNKVWSSQQVDKVLRDFQNISQEMSRARDETQLDPTLYQRYAEVMDMNPTSRLALRLAGLIDPATLATLPENSRIVFSTAPTRMQRPLPGSAKILSSFITEQGVWASSAAQLMPAPSDEGDSYLDYSMGMNSTPLKGQVAKALMSVTRFSSMGGFSVDVKVADAKGNVLATGNIGLGEGPSEEEADSLNPTKPQPEDKSPDVRLTEASKSIVLAVTAMQGSMGGMEDSGLKLIKPEFKSLILQPEDNDPLSFIAADGLHSVAETKKLNLVASIPDQALLPSLYMRSDGRPSENRFMTYFKLLGGVTIDETQPGWLTVTPDDGWNSRLTRTDRHALQVLLQNLDSKGYSLDAFATFLAKSPDVGFESVGLIMVSSLFPEVLMSGEVYDLRLVRFFGTLMADQRLRLSKGQSIAISQLMPSQKALLHKMVFEQADGMGLGQTMIEAPAMGDTEAAPPGDDEDFSMYGDLSSEATESLPNGLPPNGIFTMQTVREQIVAPVGVQSYGATYSAEDLGNQLATEERPDLFTWVNESPQISRSNFRLGERTRYTLHFQLSEKLALDKQIVDTKMSKAEPTKVNGLPAEFRKAVEEARAKAREAHKNMKAGEFEPPPLSGGPPPPRM